MKLHLPKRFQRLSNVLFLVLMVLILKLVLAFGYFALFKGKGDSSLFTASNVMAEDSKKASKESTSKKNSPAGKDAASTPEASAPASQQVSLSSVPEAVAFIEKRENELKQKEEKLKQKEEYLAQMQKETEKKINELAGIQKEIQAYRAEKEESQSARVRSLVKIYESMKPKEAAKLLENLEDKLVVYIVSSMNSNEAASILTNMEVKKAAKISEALSTHR